MKKVSVILGTRPEAIKLFPVIIALKQDPFFRCHVCVTAQHREMLDQVLDVFNIIPDVDLNLMESNQTLSNFTSRAIEKLDRYYQEEKPDLVLVQGDTTTTFAASLTAFYNRIPIGHVEAGLRTWKKSVPFPEEINRVLSSRLADLHFAPTETARKNLIQERVDPHCIFVTGNTVIDALHFAIRKIREHPPEILELPRDFFMNLNHQTFVLITGHRRESFGSGFESICKAIKHLSEQFPEKFFVYPVHLNPNVRKPVLRLLSECKNVFLIKPMSYLHFVSLMERCYFILTDSGGIQEEAAGLSKPVLIIRETTERPEAIETGIAKLVGTDTETIVREASRLLRGEGTKDGVLKTKNPYGDGHAAFRIVEICRQFFLR